MGYLYTGHVIIIYHPMLHPFLSFFHKYSENLEFFHTKNTICHIRKFGSKYFQFLIIEIKKKNFFYCFIRKFLTRKFAQIYAS